MNMNIARAVPKFLLQSARHCSNAIPSAAVAASPPPTTDHLLTAQHIAAVVAAVPQLRPYDAALWRRTHAALADQGFAIAAFQRLISGQPALLTWQPATLQQAVEGWRGATQFGDRRVLELLVEYPQLFAAGRDERELSERVRLLRDYAGTAKNVWRMLMNAPNLLADREEVIEARVEYVRDRMRAEVADVVKSRVMAHSVQSVRTRHVFAERLGVYKPRSLKVSVQQQQDACRNPRMHAMYDTEPKEFATKVCGVSLEEWEVFERLYAVELEKGGEDLEGEEAYGG